MAPLSLIAWAGGGGLTSRHWRWRRHWHKRRHAWPGTLRTGSDCVAQRPQL